MCGEIGSLLLIGGDWGCVPLTYVGFIDGLGSPLSLLELVFMLVMRYICFPTC